ncbi:MAG: amino acid ABC transporter substrate-binding protein [Syntrophorhabdales bacterium]|jgi:branched-chain amino acid transport system substrate-binding protein
MRTRYALALFLVLVGFVVFSSVPASAKDSIRFGYSIALTGVLSPNAEGVVEAYAVWHELVNKRGGIYVKEEGKKLPVEMVFYDDQSEPGTAVRIYEKLITQDKVDLILPPCSTDVHFGVAPLAQKYKIPLVGGTAASVKLRELKNDWFWFVSWMPDWQERAVVDLLKDLQIKTVAVAYLQQIFPKENLQTLEPALKEAGINLLLLKDYPVAEKDLKTLLSQIKAKNPEAAVFLSYPADTFTIVTQAQEVGLNPKFMFNLIGPAAIAFKPKFGPAVEGIACMGNWSPKMNTFGNKEFVDAFQAKYKKLPDAVNSSLAYMPCQIMEQAIEKVGSLDRKKLRDYIAAHEFQTVEGPVKFQGSENIKAVSGILQWQKGALEVIWPKNIATAKPMFPKPAWPK